MKTTYIIVSVFCSMLFNLAPTHAQSNIGDRFIIGTSLTYIWEHNELLPSTYNEFTWNKNIAVNVNEQLYVGISYQNIFTNGSTVSFAKEENSYFILGIFTQYDFLPQKKNRLFAEASWNYGNYCTCENGDPFKKEGLNYLGIGAGYDFPINKYLSLDLSFVSHIILGSVERKYGFTQYIIGLNFDLLRE